MRMNPNPKAAKYVRKAQRPVICRPCRLNRIRGTRIITPATKTAWNGRTTKVTSATGSSTLPRRPAERTPRIPSRRLDHRLLWLKKGLSSVAGCSRSPLDE